MKNFSIRSKLMVVIFMAIIMTAIVAFLGLYGMNKIAELNAEASYDENIHQQVQQALIRLDHYYSLYEDKILTLDEAKKQAADMLRELRYGKSGYFWADDVEGNNIVLLGSETEGTNRMDTVDANGFAMVKELIAVGQNEDGGYVDYMFPKEGETEPKQKRGYTKYYELFGWVVGTGNYLEDMDEIMTDSQMEVNSINDKLMKAILFVSVFLSIVIIMISLYIAKDITVSIKYVMELLHKLSNGDLTF